MNMKIITWVIGNMKTRTRTKMKMNWKYLFECRGIVGAVPSDSDHLSPRGYVWVNDSFHLRTRPLNWKSTFWRDQELKEKEQLSIIDIKISNEAILPSQWYFLFELDYVLIRRYTSVYLSTGWDLASTLSLGQILSKRSWRTCTRWTHVTFIPRKIEVNTLFFPLRDNNILYVEYYFFLLQLKAVWIWYISQTSTFEATDSLSSTCSLNIVI